MSKSLVNPTARIFCKGKSIIIASASFRPRLPLFLRALKEQARPMDAKNIFIKKSCRTWSNSISKLPLVFSIKTTKLTISPPITGAGIKNFFRNSDFSLILLPKINARIAIPRLCIISNVMCISSSFHLACLYYISILLKLNMESKRSLIICVKSLT